MGPVRELTAPCDMITCTVGVHARSGVDTVVDGFQCPRQGAQYNCDQRRGIVGVAVCENNWVVRILSHSPSFGCDLLLEGYNCVRPADSCPRTNPEHGQSVRKCS